MDADEYARIQHGAYLPRPEDVAAYHGHVAGCPDCQWWGEKLAEADELEPRRAPRPRWWTRLWRLMFMVALMLITVAPAHAIPACWQVSPNAEVPWVPDSTPIDCGGKQAFVLEGMGAWAGSYLEMPESSLWIHGVSGAHELAPYIVWSYFNMTGPARIVNPDLYVTQWLLGSDWYPEAARWTHEHIGVPAWGPYVPPTPLEHSPEPTTLLLLGTALTWIGWRVRRR
jgi:hypothetical protein